jgi:hypothetical protein
MLSLATASPPKPEHTFIFNPLEPAFFTFNPLETVCFFANLPSRRLKPVWWPWEGSVRRIPAKTQHDRTAKPKRNNGPTAARPASSTLADLQEQVSALTRELREAQE